ncbi:PREDICTED: probable chitinase 3 [Trachymyrmex cornetzi]|uniref:probable chitinase 3 n=1 Tax=Trachymyrmex cornetzi TaxID=471704 RepID=UPI00084F353F|nr:PREDICTED: probable chitinase 3 [Trachymyrmex cornetzi]
MKGIYLLAIAFLAFWTVTTASKLPIIFETENECPVTNITTLPKLIFHETNCTKYYECKNGQKQLHSCKVGLYFSRYWQGCVNREHSDCRLTTLTPIPTTQTSIPTTPTSPECPYPDTCPLTLIPIKPDCTKYYECKNSKKELRFCKAGLYFSQYWQGCVSRENSDCILTTLTPIPTTQTPIPTTQTPIPTTQTPIPTTSTSPECPNPDTCPPKLISDEKDCTKYYQCKSSTKEPRSCKVGLYFSRYWQGCVNREYSDCPLTISTSTPTPITPTPTSTIPHGCINGDLLEHECTCTKYYLCIDGYKALLECPPGKHFDISTKTCQPGTGCLQVAPSPISSPTSIPITSQCTKDEYMPHEYECKKYYECKVGRKILRECNDGMIFDEALQTCVLGQC